MLRSRKRAPGARSGEDFFLTSDFKFYGKRDEGDPEEGEGGAADSGVLLRGRLGRADKSVREL